MKRAKYPINPTIVMNLQLGAMEDNPLFGILEESNEDKDDEEFGAEHERSSLLEGNETHGLYHPIRTDALSMTTQHPKRPLITEVEDERRSD